MYTIKHLARSASQFIHTYYLRNSYALLGSAAAVLLIGLFYLVNNLRIDVPAPHHSAVTITRGTLPPLATPTSSKVLAAQPAKLPPIALSAHANQYGFSAGDLPGLPASELEARLSDMNALGVTWMRFDMPWNDIQPDGPTIYNWSGYDRVVAAANKHKLNMLVILDYTPAWARQKGCADTNKCPPTDNTQFAQFAAAAASRFGPKGLNSWEIWNEPNHMGAWAPAPDPTAYTNLLIPTYTAIKKADPSAFVITGGTGVTYTENGNYSPSDFLAAIYKNGGKNSFDGVGQHPYSFPALATLNEAWTGWYQMLAVRSLMVANDDSAKPVWLTEYGAPTNGPGAVATQQNYNFEQNPDHVDEALQQKITSVAIGLYKTYDWVGPMMWYGYKDLGTQADSNEDFFGLVRADGSHKPAYDTFKASL